MPDWLRNNDPGRCAETRLGFVRALCVRLNIPLHSLKILTWIDGPRFLVRRPVGDLGFAWSEPYTEYWHDLRVERRQHNLVGAAQKITSKLRLRSKRKQILNGDGAEDEKIIWSATSGSMLSLGDIREKVDLLPDEWQRWGQRFCRCLTRIQEILHQSIKVLMKHSQRNIMGAETLELRGKHLCTVARGTLDLFERCLTSRYWDGLLDLWLDELDRLADDVDETQHAIADYAQRTTKRTRRRVVDKVISRLGSVILHDRFG